MQRRSVDTLASFIRKETRHILRDRKTLVVLLALPIVMVLLFGYALRTDVRNVRVVVVDPARDGLSLELTQHLSATPALRVVAVHATSDAVEEAFRSGTADIALILPGDFTRRLHRGRLEVMLLSDGSNPNYAQTTESYVRAALLRWSARQQGEAAGGAVRIATRMRFNPTLESSNLLVPGLLAFVLTLISALMTAISIAREKEQGTMEVLLVSPLRPIQVIVGKVVPYLLLAFADALSVLFIARVVFNVPVRGSLLLLLGASLLFVLVSLSVGVLIAIRMPDQRAAMVATLLGLLFPTIILSGFIFPISSLPVWLQPLTRIIPATYYIVITRGIMLKDVGLDVLWPQFAVLTGMAVLLLGVSTRALQDRL